MRVGIDLGTTFSLIARVDQHGTPVLFPDQHEPNRFQTPSVVHIGAGGALVGQAVEERLEDDPELPVVRFPKLGLGRAEAIFVDHQGRGWHPEAICGLILAKLMRDAAAVTDEAIEGAVVSVPAHFNDAQRQATRDAAALAGLKVLDLVEEPLAAATYYGARSMSPGDTFLVHDLGGGTFDATVMRVDSDGPRPMAADGCSDLGGKNFDEIVMELIGTQFQQSTGYDPRQHPASLGRLRREAESLKIKLSTGGQERIRKPFVIANRGCEVMLTRSQFDAAIQPLIDRAVDVCERALAAARLRWDGVDRILLAGGSSMIPAVKQALLRASGKPPDKVQSRQPHYAIVYGAAMFAGQTTGGRSLRRIAPFDLGYRVRDPVSGRPTMQTVIARNTPIPARATHTCYTNRAEQDRIILDVVQADAAVGAPVSLGHFAFPVARAGKNHPLEVTIGYDERGMARVEARDPTSGRTVHRDFSGTSRPDERIMDQKRLLETVRSVD